MDKDIKTLIERFMAGETTLTEEQQLADYLRTHVCSTQEERTVKAMFGWFDSGMPLDQGNNPVLNNETERKPSSRRMPLLKLVGAAVAAAAVAITIVMTWPVDKQTLTADSAKPSSSPTIIAAAKTDTMALDTARTIAPIKKITRPSRSKYRDQPTPPKVYYAKTMADTMNNADILLAEKEIDELNRSQEEWMRQMDEHFAKQNLVIDLYMAVLDASAEETEEQEVY